jgi:hypothetical protein
LVYGFGPGSYSRSLHPCECYHQIQYCSCNAYLLLQLRSCFPRKSIYFSNLRWYRLSSTFFSWNCLFRSVSLSPRPSCTSQLIRTFRIGNLLGQKDAERAGIAARAALALVIVISAFTGFVPIIEFYPKSRNLSRALQYLCDDIREVLGASL